MEEKNFNIILKEQIELKSLTVQKLASLTGIHERYIEALVEGEAKKLPPSPYVRGYVVKLAGFLNLDGEEFWSLYCKEYEPVSSGANDILPSNRFAIKTISRGKIFVYAVFALLLVYGVTQFNHFAGVPEISIKNPESTALLIVTQENFVVSGILKNPKDKLFVNDENIVPDNNGSFSKEISLQPGINYVAFRASRFLGKETSVTRQILYQP